MVPETTTLSSICNNISEREKFQLFDLKVELHLLFLCITPQPQFNPFCGGKSCYLGVFSYLSGVYLCNISWHNLVRKTDGSKLNLTCR